MLSRSVLYFFLLSSCAQISIAADIRFYEVPNTDFLNELLQEIRNLTDAIRDMEGNAANLTQTAEAFLDFVSLNWPQLEKYLSSIADIPSSITLLVSTVNNFLPYIETCAYVVGGCILLSAVIVSVTKIIDYCRYRNRNFYIHP